MNKSIENNLILDAERKKLETAKQNKNISRSEFLPSITISGDQTSTTSTNKTNQSGASLADSNLDLRANLFLLSKKFFQVSKELIHLKKLNLKQIKPN